MFPYQNVPDTFQTLQTLGTGDKTKVVLVNSREFEFVCLQNDASILMAMEFEIVLKHAPQSHQESIAAEENYSSLPRRFRPHSCEDCSKCFTKLSDLKRHVQTHTGEKPHTCEECSKSFVKSSDLKRHALTHSGKKPFECSKCLKCFTKSSYLQKHMEKHYIDEPYKCGDCMLRFVSLADLGRHMETHLFELVQFASPSCSDAIETAKSSTSLPFDIVSMKMLLCCLF